MLCHAMLRCGVQAVASWEVLATLAGLSVDGDSSAETLGASPHELLQQWSKRGEGPGGYRRGGQMQWGEICARLLSGRLGMEAVVRQRLGVPVLSDDSDRAEVAGACAEFVRRGVLGVRPDPALGARDWAAAVRAATEGLEFGQSGGESVRRIGE
jgi:hypothetical protein